MTARLLLDPDPRSVGRARHWVVEELERLGRPDLTDAAELGISELVTNAILHAEPPITVRLRGSRERPRVEVHDTSARPPSVGGDMSDDDHLMHTVGRGMGIVALYSRAWGADLSDEGKVVWFVPSGDPGVEFAEEGDVYDLAEAVDAAMRRVESPEPMLTIHLLGMPAQVFASFRGWYSDIRRELRLLSFSQNDQFPVAGELTELTVQVEHERRLARGLERLDEAIAAEQPTADLEYVVPESAPASMERMLDVLERADRLCRDLSLLTVPATPQQLALMRWYSGEFVRQARGEPPLRWSGSTEVDPSTA